MVFLYFFYYLKLILKKEIKLKFNLKELFINFNLIITEKSTFVMEVVPGDTVANPPPIWKVNLFFSLLINCFKYIS